MLNTGFPPVVSDNAKVLILGSMPGKRSLEINQYYAHPRNLFWYFMGEICGANPDLPYDDRIHSLKRAGVALWDVLKRCTRKGSLDNNIIKETEVPNNFQDFLNSHSSLRAICFNGKKAETVFYKHVIKNLSEHLLAYLDLLSLPSTSPANTAMSKDKKLGRWRAIEQYL